MHRVVFKDIKNFFVYEGFFKIVIDINIISLCINSAKYNGINIYKTQLGNLDLLKKISRLENLNLNPFEIQKLRSQAT